MKEMIQAQWSGVKSEWDTIANYMQEIGEMNEANKKGEPVDLKRLDEIIAGFDSLIDGMMKQPGGFMLRGTVNPILRKMHTWRSDIQKKQAVIGNTYQRPEQPEATSASTPPKEIPNVEGVSSDL